MNVECEDSTDSVALDAEGCSRSFDTGYNEIAPRIPSIAARPRNNLEGGLISAHLVGLAPGV